MSWLGGWLREIILIVLIATFVELLLPSKSMERYARLVLSLLVLLTILNPVISLLKGDAASQLTLAFSRLIKDPGGTGSDGDIGLKRILADGQKMAAGSQERGLKLAAQEIARQMIERINDQTGRSGARVSVTLALTEQSGQSVPAIEGVTVTLPPQGQTQPQSQEPGAGTGPISVKPVETVKVNVSGVPENEGTAANGGEARPAAAGPVRQVDEDSGAEAVTSLLAKDWSIDPARITVILESDGKG